MNIRVAVDTDLDQLLALEQKIIESERPYYAYIKENNVSYYDLPGLISSIDSQVIVVESEQQITGCGYAQMRSSKTSDTHSEHCYLGFIYLEPECRGKAMGQAIIDVLKAWGVEHGAKHFQLDVYADNVAAIRAYEKAGFAAVTVKMELVV